MTVSPLTILFIDDDPNEGDLFVRALRRSGFNNPVQVFTSTDEAKHYLRGDGKFGDRARFPFPSLVVLDQRMPGENGWDVLQWMREDAFFGDLPAVVLSGSGAAADEAKANELGAAYLVKPHLSEEYEAIVKRIAEFWLRKGGH